MNNVIKRKAKLPNTFPTALLYHPDFYNIPDINNLQAMSKINELLVRLNGNTIATKTSRIRLANLQQSHWSAFNILEFSKQEKNKAGFNLIADIINLMHNRKIKIKGDITLFWKPSITKEGK